MNLLTVNLFWSLLPSIWKSFSIILFHKMGNLSTSLLPTNPSIISCVLKLFERVIQFRLLCFLLSYFMVSPHQANFRSSRSAHNQIIYLSQSFTDGFNKHKQGCWMVLATMNFLKVFDSVLHFALFRMLIFVSLSPCCTRWTQSFFSVRSVCVLFNNTKIAPFKFTKVFCKNSSLYILYFFSSVIFLYLCLPLPIEGAATLQTAHLAAPRRLFPFR